MKPNQAAIAIEHCVTNRIPLMLWGPPGVGKTDVVNQVGAKLKRDVQIECPAQLDAVDTRGLAERINGSTIFTRPEMLPSTGSGILFLDDMNTGAPLVINALLQLVRGRRLGKHPLGDGWDIIAACNRITDKAHVQRLSSAMNSRFVHVNFDPDHLGLVKHAAAMDWSPAVIAYLQMRPELIHAYTWAESEERKHGIKPDVDMSGAFECSRSWESMSKLDKSGCPDEIFEEMAAGTVGKRSSIEFCAFRRIYPRMPNPAQVLMNPDRAPIPDQVDVSFALTGALAKIVTRTSMDRLVRYGARLSKEYEVAMIVHAVNRDATLAQTDAFIRWSAANQDVLF
jgi:AAA domain (dynein-related subfamily)